MSSPDKLIKNVVVLGGGTAGWLTAARLAHDHCAKDEAGINLTLLESPEVRTLGVGEGSWPTLRMTLRELGISELDFIRSCDVSFKQGSKFVDWCTGVDGEFYYHPFTPPEAMATIDINRAWLEHDERDPFAFSVSAQARLCEEGLAPKQIQTPDYAAFSNYAYHLDAAKFAEFLKRYCIDRLGVYYIQDHVQKSICDEDGYISALKCERYGELEADLFIDCSGASAALISEHYQASFIDASQYLFNNCALAVHAPYINDEADIPSATLSTALDCAWVWDIGLPSRRGVGLVYSDAFCSDQLAWQRLSEYLMLSLDPSIVDGMSPKKLQFKPGYLTTPWVKNCIAIGMSSGFIEPLEASAIAMIEVCAKTLSNEFPSSRDVMSHLAKRYNQRFVERWESVIDFLKLHYYLSQRKDSDYWLEHQRVETLPTKLSDLLDIWQYQSPSSADFNHVLELFGPPSYQYILYGMGFKPKSRVSASIRDNPQAAEKAFDSVKRTITMGLRGLPKNRELLKRINSVEA